MSSKRLERCAARLPADEGARFLRDQGEAQQLIAAGHRMRRQTWRRYREIVLEDVGELHAAGLDQDEIAARLNMTRAALRSLLALAARDRGLA